MARWAAFLLVVACGRIGFDATGAATGDGPINGDTVLVGDGMVSTARHWVNRGASPPGPLQAPRITFDSRRSRILMYGGQNATTESAAMWSLTSAGWQQVCAACPPGARLGVGLGYDPIRDRVIVFGGTGVTGPLGDTWEFDGTSWIQTATTGPAARAQTNLLFDPASGKLVLVGGIDTGMFRPLVFSYDGTWVDISPTGTNPNIVGGFGQTIALDSDSGDKFSLAGVGTTDDTLWQLTTKWLEVCTNCTGNARRDASMVFDPALHSLWLVGGANATDDIAGTWALVGTSWSQVFPDPPARSATALGYDPVRDVIVLYGGHSQACAANFHCDETWEFVRD